jgi:putative membrane protein
VLAAVDPWRWQFHPEVWLLVGSVVGLYTYAVKVIGPKAVGPGRPAVTRAQVTWFVVAVVVLYVASDWPLHDISEEYLYSAHMLQHMLLSYMLPAMVWLATPEWLARLIVGRGRTYGWVRRLARPIPAAILFNGIIAVTHWPAIVNASVDVAPLHYGVHLVLVLTSLIMWLPVCGPLPELRISLPAQMIYLFLQSIIPTLPAGWLTFAEHAVYHAYDIPFRMFGWSVEADQQLAGLIMKLGGSAFLWACITALFFKWFGGHIGEQDGSYRRVGTVEPVLTYDEVERAFNRVPAATEPDAR